MTASRFCQTPQVAVGAIVIKEGKILLIERNKAPHRGLWAIPGGSVEFGETLQEAVEREIREETGLTVRANAPIHTFDLIERDDGGAVRFHYVIVDLSAEFISGELRPADDALDACWFAPEEIQHISMSDSTLTLLHKMGFLPSA